MVCYMDKQESVELFANAEYFLSKEEIDKLISLYERRYGMDSEEMLRRNRERLMPDNEHIMDWLILLDMR